MLEILKIIFLVLSFIEGFIFLRFCISQKIFLALLFKIFILFLAVLSFEYDFLLFGFVFLSLSITFVIALIYQFEFRYFFLKYKSLEVNDSAFIKKLFGINENFIFSTRFLDDLIESVFNLSEKGIGALIVIERKISLDYYIKNGYLLNTDVDSIILETIFNKNSLLHDGAVIIRDGKIVAAKCFLPINFSYNIDFSDVKHLGARHRAAIGITQTTDAISIVVSETTSYVSFCKDGKIKYNVNSEELYEELKNSMMFNVLFEEVEKKA